MDPLTLGELTSSALAIVTEAVAEKPIEPLVRDAYSTLVNRLNTFASAELKILEAHPQSSAAQMALADQVARQNQQTQEEIRRLTIGLIDFVRHSDTSENIMTDDLYRIQERLVRSVGGHTIGSVNITGSGNVVIGSIKSGIEPTEPWPEKPRR